MLVLIPRGASTHMSQIIICFHKGNYFIKAMPVVKSYQRNLVSKKKKNTQRTIPISPCTYKLLHTACFNRKEMSNS